MALRILEVKHTESILLPPIREFMRLFAIFEFPSTHVDERHLVEVGITSFFEHLVDVIHSCVLSEDLLLVVGEACWHPCLAAEPY